MKALCLVLVSFSNTDSAVWSLWPPECGCETGECGPPECLRVSVCRCRLLLSIVARHGAVDTHTQPLSCLYIRWYILPAARVGGFQMRSLRLSRQTARQGVAFWCSSVHAVCVEICMKAARKSSCPNNHLTGAQYNTQGSGHSTARLRPCVRP